MYATFYDRVFPDAAPVNQVSSCNLWEDPDAMSEFFFADGGTAASRGTANVCDAV